MFLGRGRQRRSADGPVAIPRGEQVQLLKQDPIQFSSPLPSPAEAASNTAWYGQSYEYAAGLALKEHVLDPLEEGSMVLPEETARFLSLYSRGKIVFLHNASGAVHVASIDRVTNADQATLRPWWTRDKVLPYTGDKSWSDWWLKRCGLFDPGCEMVKLTTEHGEILGVAYFERHVADRNDGNRVTLIRGIRVDPEMNPETLRRESKERASSYPIAYPGIAATLLFHVMFQSLHFGTQCVAVNSPKDDTVEDFYQHYMGFALQIDPVDGRRYFRLDSAGRFELIRSAFSQQINLMLEYKEQIRMHLEFEEDECRVGEEKLEDSGLSTIPVADSGPQVTKDNTPLHYHESAPHHDGNLITGRKITESVNISKDTKSREGAVSPDEAVDGCMSGDVVNERDSRVEMTENASKDHVVILNEAHARSADQEDRNLVLSSANVGLRQVTEDDIDVLPPTAVSVAKRALDDDLDGENQRKKQKTDGDPPPNLMRGEPCNMDTKNRTGATGGSIFDDPE